MKHRRLLLLLPVALTLPLLAAACGGDEADSSEPDSSQALVLQLADRVSRNEMIFAAVTIADLPLHELDTAVQKGTIEGDYLPVAREIVRLTAVTNWSVALEESAQKMNDDAEALVEALDSGADVETVKPLSQALHEDWHTFPEEAWGHLAGDTATGGDGHEDSHDDGADDHDDAGASETPMSHE